MWRVLAFSITRTYDYNKCVLATRTYVVCLYNRDSDDTDTDDTGSEDDVGGLGKFSHGLYGLAHQHWVAQVISAGSFSVHNTEAPEAHHKLCMRLASFRVRHLHESKTKSSMLKYLCFHDLFNEMTKDSASVPTTRYTNYPCGVRVTLPIEMCALKLLQSGYQQQFLHSEALITRYGRLDFVCMYFFALLCTYVTCVSTCVQVRTLGLDV